MRPAPARSPLPCSISWAPRSPRWTRSPRPPISCRAQNTIWSRISSTTQFFQWDQATYNSYFHRIKDAVDLTIPKLNEMAYEQVEVSSVPFLKFVANKGTNDEAANYSFVLHGYVRHWLANVWS